MFLECWGRIGDVVGVFGSILWMLRKCCGDVLGVYWGFVEVLLRYGSVEGVLRMLWGCFGGLSEHL